MEPIESVMYEEDFTDELKERILEVIKKSFNGKIDSDGDAAILFHWVRHKDDPIYSFVPEEYRRF